MFKAILSTTVLPLDGTYKITTLSEVPDITGVPHYIGHPATREIVENLGAVKAETNLFLGLLPGEQAICFPIQQGVSSRKEEGFSSPHQDISISKLSIRVIIRIDKPFAGACNGHVGWYDGNSAYCCGNCKA